MTRHTFKIGNTTYIPDGKKRLYQIIGSEIETLSDIEENEPYLIEEHIGVFEKRPQWAHAEMVFREINGSSEKLYTNNSEEFTGAIPLESVVPEEIAECPECGSYAGEIQSSGTPKCFSCGYNTGMQD